MRKEQAREEEVLYIVESNNEYNNYNTGREL